MVPTRHCGNRETTRAVTDNAYPKLAGGAPDLPALELDVLDHWAS